MDERAIVLTDKYLYKLDPRKSFHVKKTGISINDITGLSVTSGKEQLVVIHLVSNNDLVFYMHTKLDRVGEFVGLIAKLKRKSYVTLLLFQVVMYCNCSSRPNFTVDVQRYISAQIDKHNHIINIISGGVDKVEFRKGSNKNISLLLPNSD